MRRRTWRGVLADLQHAERAIARAAEAGMLLSCGALAAALWEGLVQRAWELARPLSVAFAAGLALSFLTLRGSRAAATALPLLFTVVGGTYAWRLAPSHHVAYVLYFLAFPLLATYRGLYTFRVRRLLDELQATWSPRDVAAGDVYTVRDGTAYGVVKVLAVDAERVHVRQFGLRYAERPWHVKSSTLERSHAGPGQAYAHLPLERSAFAMWEPHLIRSEPLYADELRALDGWRRVHCPDSPASPSSG